MQDVDVEAATAGSSARPAGAIVGDWGSPALDPAAELAEVNRRLRRLYVYLLNKRAAWANHVGDPGAVPRAVAYQHAAGLLANIIQGLPSEAEDDPDGDALTFVAESVACPGCSPTVPPGTAVLRHGQVVGYAGPPVPFIPSIRFEVDDTAGLRSEDSTEESCGACYACIGNLPVGSSGHITLGMTRMITCVECGNKRCPHGTDHRLACTGSNDPGQAGSRYGGITPAEEEPAGTR